MSRCLLHLLLLFSLSSFSDAQQPSPVPGAAPGAAPVRGLGNSNSACKIGQPSVNPTSLVDLTLYVNTGTGTALDHYLSALPANDPALAGYKPEKILGKVLYDGSACDCPVRLAQFVDNSTSPFGQKIDHKYARDGDEPDRFGENYTETNEVMYCVQRKGGCGASIPLYKEWNAFNYDSSYSTNETSITPWTERYPPRPLCYIWPTDQASAQNAAAMGAQMATGAMPMQSQIPGQPAPQPGQSLASGAVPGRK